MNTRVIPGVDRGGDGLAAEVLGWRLTGGGSRGRGAYRPVVAAAGGEERGVRGAAGGQAEKSPTGQVLLRHSAPPGINMN
jgi:hypothetical protein